MKKFINSIKKDPFILGVIFISLLILIIGSLTFGFLESIIFVIIIDIIVIAVMDGKPKKGKSKKQIAKKNPVITSRMQQNNNQKIAKDTKEKHPRKLWKRVLTAVFTIGIVGLTLCLAFMFYIVISAPEFTTDKLYNKEASILYANTDSGLIEIAKLGVETRVIITYDQLSEALIDAVIATEDSRFFQHDGVDLPRFMKASIGQLFGKDSGGASTITMQLVKNAFTSTESEGIAGITRKFTDVYMAVFKLEKVYTKEQILELYVNSYNMGNGNYGVEQASQDYFGKSASELNVAEAAMIAGMFQAPSAYNPYVYPEACEERRQTVLYLMLRHEFITEEEYQIAKELTVDKLITSNTYTNEYHSFIETVVSEVYTRTGNDPYSVPMKIYTTMNVDFQNTINGVMSGQTYKWYDDYAQAAITVTDVNTGAIVAIGGTRNIDQQKVLNRAISNKRQIGSTAKPLYDYGPGIEYNNWNTATTFNDAPHAYSDGNSIKNFDSSYKGLLTLNDSLKYSRNIPALKAFQQVNKSNIIEFTTSLGLSPEIDGGSIHEAHSIGGYNGESTTSVAAAYAAFSNGGYYIEPHSFTKLVYRETNEEYTVKPITRRAMSESTAYMITKVLEDTGPYVAGSINGVNFAAKTGTTDLSSEAKKEHNLGSGAISDKWLAGYNDSYTVVVWYGYDSLSKDHYLTGSNSGSAPIWKLVAKSVFTKKSTWNTPSGVVAVQVEKELDDAKLASEYTPASLKTTAYFKKGFEPTEVSTRFSQLNNVTNLNYDENTSVLSWDLIATPDFLDEAYLTTLFQNIDHTSNISSLLSDRLAWNKKNIGTVTYQVYIKNSNGALTLLGTTANSNYRYVISGPTTFVVKTTYTIFKDNASSGAEFSIQSSSSLITSELNGNSVVNLNIGETFSDIANPISVYENLIDVTANATVTKKIIDLSSNTEVNYIDISIAGSYEITYYITYKTYSGAEKRVVNVQ